MSTRFRLAATAAVAVLLWGGDARANLAPAAPTITEPGVDGQVVNAADVHMECEAFSDPDPGDAHRCSDWEIWTISPSERVWFISCIDGVARVHTHLGDGTFEGSHAGRQDLEFETDFELRARHRDDSDDPATEWSGWAARSFRTAASVQRFPLLLDDILESPAPSWADTAGTPIVLPPGSPAPRLRVESSAAELMLGLSGFDGSVNLVTNPPPIADHVPARVAIEAGDSGANLVLPPSDLTFVNDEGESVVIVLPGIDLAPSGEAYFWVSQYGSTFVGADWQQNPNFNTLARDLDVPWATRQPDYEVDIFATGFQLPVSIALVPDPVAGLDEPFLYVTELYGTIRVVSRAGRIGTFATDLLNFDPSGNFPGSGELGLTGITVDPVSGDVFASMMYASDADPEVLFPKVDRFSSTDGGRSAATRTTILDMVGESQGASHQISNLSIGPDGKLYVHMGDGFEPATAQDLDSFRGKILRVNLDGTAPGDNPFHDAADGINARDYVFAYGLRNPFGGGWRDRDGRLYEVENGPWTDRMAQVVEGRNYLWDGRNPSMLNFAIYDWTPAHAPVDIAFAQHGDFGGGGFPIEEMDHAFVTESGPTYAAGPQVKGKRIVEFELDAVGDRVHGPETLVEYVGTGRGTAAGLTFGPDGLYFTDLYKNLDAETPIDPGASVLRVRSTRVPRLGLTVAPGDLFWGALAGAEEYDVIRGELETLRSSLGDFTPAVSTCLAQDETGTTIAEPATPEPGTGFWYLVRERAEVFPGSYESGGTSQLGLRDAEIEASELSCGEAAR